ncbi:MAG: DUF4388 domain-containing protein [bacterium]
MVDTHSSQSTSEHVGEVESALLDAELFIKYKAPERAIKCLKDAIENHARSLPLRERLRELAVSLKNGEEAARQCLALANLYIDREDFDTAHDRLLEAKRFDAHVNIAGGLESIRRARRPDLSPVVGMPDPGLAKGYVTLGGDLTSISIFEAIQVIENAKLTGTLVLTGETQSGTVFFNQGRIVDAESGGAKGTPGFRPIVEITNGTFEFHKSAEEFPIKIEAASNTNLLLDTLTLLDEAKQQD